MNELALLKLATDQFKRLVSSVKADQWNAATPDTDWDTRELVNHMVNELMWIKPMVEGKTIAEVADKFDGDLLGNDPVMAATVAADSAVETLSQPGALERTVHLSMGDTSAADYCEQITSDIAVHNWDLAKAIGADTKIDPSLVALANKIFGPMAEGARSKGLFGPIVEVPEDSDAQTKMLAMTGRKA